MSDFLPIYDLTPFTMLDFPGHVSAIVWFAGCNMRCPYCHNPDIVKGKSGKLKEQDVLSFLKDRIGLLDGVVLSGGEATLYAGIIPFARKVREMGMSIKLDTNGTRPNIIRQMLSEKLLDYIALDYKAPIDSFLKVTGIKSKIPFDETLSLLCAQDAVPVEIRTTVHTALLGEEDIKEIMLDLEKQGFKGSYYVQNYHPPVGKTLGNLPSQDIELVPPSIIPASFSLGFRNFKA